MKIIHVVSGLDKASGVTTFVENVAEVLAGYGHCVSIITKESARGCCEIASADIVHIHGLWDPWLCRYLAQAPSRAAIVWSPHGMLTPWALRNKWWKKFAALALYQYWSLRKADLIHVTAQSEVEDVRRLGLKNEIVIAPLGVRVKGESVHSQPQSSTSTSASKTLLFVSRVQRKKGLPNLLDAWARLPKDLKKDWTIRIVGPDQDGHTAELMRQCESLGLTYSDQEGKFHSPTPTSNSNVQPEVAFVGPKYDEELDWEYGTADLFVLPTHSENFGSVVIEALARGVPVICTKEAPWEELETHKCGWWIDDNVDSLEATLRSALNTPTLTLETMGANGRSLVESKYDWKAIGKTIADAYWAISHGCEKGRCVDCSELYDACSL